jgi:hypothetical protein
MAFGTPVDQKMSTLSTITGSGSTVTGIDLVADCAGNPGSPEDISLWDDFKASGTVSCSPTSGTATEGEDFDVKIVPATVGTYWDTRIGALASNYNRGFTFSEERTQGDAAQVDSSSRPRGDTKRYDMDLNGDTHVSPQITITAQIIDTAGAGGGTFVIGDWCGGDSNTATCVATIAEGFD